MGGRGRRERELERRADELLVESIRRHGRGEYPCYTERWMNLLSERECPGVEKLPSPPIAGEFEAIIGGMIVDANLTRRQRMVIRWIARGLSQRQIAEMMGLSESQVCRIKQAALRRMREAGVLS